MSLHLKPPSLPQQTNLLAAANAVTVVRLKAALGTTDAVVNAVAKVAEAVLKVAQAKAVMNATTTSKTPMHPAANVLKADVAEAEVNVQTVAAAKKLQAPMPLLSQQPTKQASTLAIPPNAHRVKKPTDAVVVVVGVSATTKAPPTRKCHWQKKRLPAPQMVWSRKLCPTLLRRQAKAASVSMSAANDATVTAMAANAHPVLTSPQMTVLGHLKQLLRLPPWSTP